jgi:hypothetical protein
MVNSSVTRGSESSCVVTGCTLPFKLSNFNSSPLLCRGGKKCALQRVYAGSRQEVRKGGAALNMGSHRQHTHSDALYASICCCRHAFFSSGMVGFCERSSGGVSRGQCIKREHKADTTQTRDCDSKTTGHAHLCDHEGEGVCAHAPPQRIHILIRVPG